MPVFELEQAMKHLRDSIESIKKMTQRNKESISEWKFNDNSDTWEMIANVTFVYRHLEDAKMRAGKVIQAYHGWVNIYEPKK